MNGQIYSPASCHRQPPNPTRFSTVINYFHLIPDTNKETPYVVSQNFPLIFISPTNTRAVSRSGRFVFGKGADKRGVLDWKTGPKIACLELDRGY